MRNNKFSPHPALARVLEGSDGCSTAGAAKLAAVIQDYWLKRGLAVGVWVEDDAAGRVVRSSMVGGLPA